MTETEYVVVLTTLSVEADAEAFAEAIVGSRVAACVNILPPMQSVYRWHDGVERAPERQVVIKTSRDRLGPLWERVRALHSYEVPEFIVIPIVDGHAPYLRWIGESTRAGNEIW
ncbi:MAG TPA: divalent-cation tolerance protein CutA [Vicinamibacterales bacterium]|nr:divalent-cation tolerance protein CutA [Vicinamibacterales bacterium]